MAVVANMARMLTNQVSMAEITALMYLAEHVVVDSNYNHHEIIPITIFSMSDRKVRVVQGYFNLGKRMLDINVSRIFHFSTFFMSAERRPDFFQLLGWFTSEPVGETT
ncbi:hypothetical protein LEL_00138 [Akanthomyces lecanii RCEF 1005]|uniref:Uncharacterized protein n=1 Tax=Akanthomyces lecanii RCEF 1005 TaxID=1081108 RepID=A0A168JLA6_CORDF|nr:hypothetical protein LEL_00138 [Akanthomyces lecanii RCEF 1005]